MQIVFTEKDIKGILSDYIVSNLGKVMGIEKGEELVFKVKVSYGLLESIAITKKEGGEGDE